MFRLKLPQGTNAAARRVMMMVGLVLSLLTPLAPVLAASTTTLSGRVYNATNGRGYAGVKVTVCNVAVATTNANGNWQVAVASGASYCARVTGGAPAGVTGPQTRQNPGVAAQASYEYQKAGVYCAQTSTCSAAEKQQDRAIDGGLDFVYGGQVAATPVPAPVATVAPATPTATPTPAPTGPVAAPTDVTAKAGSATDRVIALTWKPGGDAAATVAYRLERSIDQQTWSVLAEKQAETSYDDKTVLVDVHYYYRLTALNAAGQASDPVLVDTSTGTVEGVQTKADAVYTSTDKLATVTIRPGTMADGASCTVVTSEPKQGNRHTVVGRYELNCTNKVDGAGITEFALPVSWHFALGDNMKGYVSPEVVRYVHGGDGVVIPRAVYDAKAHTITVSAPGDGQVAVLASEPDRTWVNYAAIGGLVLVLIIIGLFMPMRRHNKQNYREYLRAKYYNL